MADANNTPPAGAPTSSAGQLIAKGMNYLFGSGAQKKGMVPQGTSTPKRTPNIAPPVDQNSPNNILTVTDQMQDN